MALSDELRDLLRRLKDDQEILEGLVVKAESQEQAALTRLGPPTRRTRLP